MNTVIALLIASCITGSIVNVNDKEKCTDLFYLIESTEYYSINEGSHHIEKDNQNGSSNYPMLVV